MLSKKQIKNRQSRFYRQRKKQGWDDSDTWNLDVTIAKFILPRLIRFKKLSICTPIRLTTEKWNLILDKMIWSFNYFSRSFKECSTDLIKIKKDYKKAKQGLRLFSQYFQDLWW